MHQSKLIALLRTFSTRELREFKDFIASPFFNKNQELVQFYLYLKKIAPEFPHKKTARQKVYQQVFPKRAYDEKHLNYLMSFTLKLAEQYIGYTKYQQAGILPSCHALSSCLERNLEKHYQNIYTKTTQQLGKNSRRDSAYFYQQYLLSDLADRHFNQQKIRRFDENLQHASDHLDAFYLISKLKYTCEMLDRQKTLSVNYHLGLITHLSAYLESHQEIHSPGIAIYYQIYLTLTAENGDRHFELLKELLQKHFDQFSSFEMKEMHLMALNFCIRRVREKDERYVKEAFELFRKSIEARFLYENDLLSPWTFKNIVKLGLRLKNYDWTEQFIRTYKDDLAVEIRENALHYNLADLYYYKKDYGLALEYLQKVEYSDVFYALSSKVMLLKVYYETQEEEALYNLIASFRIYLRRNKLISDTVRSTYLNFITLLNQLVKSDGRQMEELHQRIEQTEPITDRNWLLRQISLVLNR